MKVIYFVVYWLVFNLTLSTYVTATDNGALWPLKGWETLPVVAMIWNLNCKYLLHFLISFSLVSLPFIFPSFFCLFRSYFLPFHFPFRAGSVDRIPSSKKWPKVTGVSLDAITRRVNYKFNCITVNFGKTQHSIFMIHCCIFRPAFGCCTIQTLVITS